MLKALRQIAGFLLALVILFEEWGWEALQALAERIGRWPPLHWLERRIARLPPWGALAVYFVPALGLLPVKLGALWLVGSGHALAGLGLILGAKVLGTALLARLFALTQPALMRMPWFARGYERWRAWKLALLARVRASRAWRMVGEWRRRMVAAWERSGGG